MIMHLSAPKGSSVNDGIDKAKHSLHYVTVDDAVRIIQKHGPGCLLAKVDLKHAFRICPVNKADWPLLGIYWQGCYYIDKVLPFGLRSSPYLFNRLADALNYIAEHNHNIRDLLHYLDDYLLIQPRMPAALADEKFKALLALFRRLGVPLASGDDKICPPTTVLTFLGIEFDTSRQELRLPDAKLTEIKALLATWMDKSSCSRRELLSLAGLLTFAAKVIPPGRTFVRRLFDAATELQNMDSQQAIPAGALEDIEWWLACCDEWNGTSLFIDSSWTKATDLMLWTDASGLGFGIVFASEWCYGSWDPAEEAHSIEWKELYPIVLALVMWGNHWAGRRLVVRCDNEAVCHVWKAGSSKSKPLMALMRVGLLVAAWYNVIVYLVPIPGCDNTLADCLSRLQVPRFKELHPTARPYPRVPRRDMVHQLTELHGVSYAEAWRTARTRLMPRHGANTSSSPA